MLSAAKHDRPLPILVGNIHQAASSSMSRPATFLILERVQPPPSGQLFLLHRRLPSHGNLWISPPVSVSHRLHRHLASGRSHCPGRPTLRPKLAKHFRCEPGQVQGGVQIPVDDLPTDQTLIDAMLEGHAFFDLPTAGTAFAGRKPARGDKEIPSRIGDLGFEELQQLPHRRIRDRSGQTPTLHHPQDMEVFDANGSAGLCQFSGELVLHVPADVGNLLMPARYFLSLLR